MLYLTLKAGTGTAPGTTLLSLNLTPAPDAKGIYRMSEGSIHTAYKMPSSISLGQGQLFIECNTFSFFNRLCGCGLSIQFLSKSNKALATISKGEYEF